MFIHCWKTRYFELFLAKEVIYCNEKGAKIKIQANTVLLAPSNSLIFKLFSNFHLFIEFPYFFLAWKTYSPYILPEKGNMLITYPDVLKYWDT